MSLDNKQISLSHSETDQNQSLVRLSAEKPRNFKSGSNELPNLKPKPQINSAGPKEPLDHDLEPDVVDVIPLGGQSYSPELVHSPRRSKRFQNSIIFPFEQITDKKRMIIENKNRPGFFRRICCIFGAKKVKRFLFKGYLLQ